MKKHTLALLIASTIGLTACGDENGLEGNPTISYERHIAKSLQAPTQVDFTLQGENANVPLPSFILMDTTDGTLNIPDGGDISLSNPAVAMGAVDGWSPSQPIIIPFTGIDLDPATAAGSVSILKVDDPRKGPAMKITEILAEGTHFVAQPKGGTLYIQPRTPFDEKSNYIFVVTNKLTDTQGNPVGLSSSYAALKTKTKEQTIESLKTAQSLTHLIEGTFAATQGVDAESIIYSSWFTTASAGDVLFATKGAIGSAMTEISEGKTANEVWSGSANPKGVDTTGLFSFSGNAEISALLPQPYKGLLDAKGLKTYKGTVSLPYFLETSDKDDKWKKTPWQSAMPSLAKISAVLSDEKNETYSAADQASILGQLAALPTPIYPEDLAKAASEDTSNPEVLAAQEKVLTALTGATLTLADGSQLDPERLITRYSPVPQLKSVENVPYLLIMPDLTNPDCAGGVPVNIFQHGITSVKENVLALAPGTIGDQCQALIAIDHPLHGERALSDGAIITDEDHADVYMNLTYLTVGRDNIRQSIADTMSLRASLGSIFARNGVSDPSVPAPFSLLSPFNGSSVGVGYIGHSLGAITGIGYTATINKPITDDNTENVMFKVNRAQFANPGAGIPYLLMNSTEFGAVVKDSLLTVASSDYQNFKKQFCPEGTEAETCYTGFYSNLTDAQKATVEGTFSSFAYAAQSVLDTVDPINHIGDVIANTPSYLTMVVGDEVIPNGLDIKVHTPYSPFAGTLPLIFSGYNQITETPNDALREAVNFVTGSHSSLLDPDANDAVTGEMQAQTASFIGTGNITINPDNEVLMTTIPVPTL